MRASEIRVRSSGLPDEISIKSSKSLYCYVDSLVPPPLTILIQRFGAWLTIMVPRQAPEITDTPPTPIEPQDNPIAGRLRSRSQQFLDTLIQEARSRSSSASSRHSRSSEGVKDVIVNLGLAAGSIGAEHIKPQSPHEEDVLEGVRVFLSGLQNIIRRAKTGTGNSVETIEVRKPRWCSNDPDLTVPAGWR